MVQHGQTTATSVFQMIQETKMSAIVNHLATYGVRLMLFSLPSNLTNYQTPVLMMCATAVFKMDISALMEIVLFHPARLLLATAIHPIHSNVIAAIPHLFIAQKLIISVKFVLQLKMTVALNNAALITLAQNTSVVMLLMCQLKNLLALEIGSVKTHV